MPGLFWDVAACAGIGYLQQSVIDSVSYKYIHLKL